MPILEGSFGGVTFKEIEGYRISACLTPQHGFQGLFFVYIWDRSEAETPFEQGVDVGTSGKPKRGTLEIADSDRSYKFEDISLESAQVGATRRERYRLFEFRYDKGYTSKQAVKVTLDNSHKLDLVKNALEDDYQFSLDGAKQHLLGFRARLGASQSNVYRFVSLQTGVNNVIKKVVDLNNEIVQKKAMPSFKVNFTPGPIDVNAENLLRVFVDESYGALHSELSPSLLDIAQPEMGPKGEMFLESHVRMNLDDYTPAELSQHDASASFHGQASYPQTIQTATFVFHPGKNQSLPIT